MDEGTSRLGSDQEPLIPQNAERASQTESRTHHEFWLFKLTKYCLLFEFFIELFNNISLGFLISLFEAAICESYYHRHEQDLLNTVNAFDEVHCKISPIQSKLAQIRGWEVFFETISGTPVFVRHPGIWLIEVSMMVALSVGYIADQVNNRRLFAIIVAGMVAALVWTIFICMLSPNFPITFLTVEVTHRSLPLQLVWGTSVF